MAARRRNGQLVWQPCYPCAALIVRMCRRRPDDADRSADASKKPVVVRRLAMRTRFGLFRARETRGREGSQRAVEDASPQAPPS